MMNVAEYRRGRRPLDPAVRENRGKVIVGLRLSGWKVADIARELRVPPAEVVAQTRYFTRKERQRVEEGVFRLAREGTSDAQIAESLGVEVKYIRYVAEQLRRAGLIDKRKRGPKGRQPSRSTILDPTSPRVATIIEMARRKATLEEIGAVLGLTQERVRQLRNKILAIHGAEIFGTPEVLTSAQVRKELGVSGSWFFHLIAAAGLHRQRAARRRRVVFPRADLEKLRETLRTLREVPCAVCGKPFQRTAIKQSVCWDTACRRVYSVRQRVAVLAAPLNPARLQGWYRRLWEALQGHALPSEEEWLRLSAASKLTGLTLVQVNWLGKRGILATTANPRRRWGSKPCRAYARSQLLITKEVWQAHQREA